MNKVRNAGGLNYNSRFKNNKMSESLLKKYDIPINHLDFDYIKSCENGKEIERIVTVLKSGEEGYYPDLTNCALTKLKRLNPNSKVLREEVPVLNKRSMSNTEWTHISSNVDVSNLVSIHCWIELIPIKYTKRAGQSRWKSKLKFYVKRSRWMVKAMYFPSGNFQINTQMKRNRCQQILNE